MARFETHVEDETVRVVVENNDSQNASLEITDIVSVEPADVSVDPDSRGPSEPCR